MIKLIKLYVQIQLHHVHKLLHYVHKLHNIVLLVYTRASNVGVIIFENYVEFFSKFNIIINIRESKN